MMEIQDSMPLVSVIIPVYNAELYLEQTVRSVQAQTMRNWEALLIDDGSDDHSREIMKRFADEDVRIRVFFNERNCGVAATRNRAIEESKGSYLAFLDADDVWHEQKLEKQMELAEQTGADLIYSSYALIDPEGKPCGRPFLVRPSADFQSMLARNEIGCSTVVLRKASLGTERFCETWYHEDYALWMTLLQRGCRAVGAAEVLAEYRVLPGSRSYRKFHAARMRWRIYRKMLRLPLWKSTLSFAAYMVNGLLKYLF